MNTYESLYYNISKKIMKCKTNLTVIKVDHPPQKKLGIKQILGYFQKMKLSQIISKYIQMISQCMCASPII